MNRVTVICAVVGIALISTCKTHAAAVNFQEPVDWSVGDAGSTYQEWEASSNATFTATNSLPTAIQVNPTIASDPTMSVQSPGFVAGSGGYYSFTGDYQIKAEVFNHGGAAGAGGPYSGDFGTHVIVQTAATTNPDFDVSVFPDSIEIVTLDSVPITGGTNEDLLSTTEVYRAEVNTPFGLAEQQELVFEFLLPGYTSDFRVQFLASVHSSFSELRIDTFLVETASDPGDFDGNGFVDGDDLHNWQTHYGIDAGGDADGDGDTDGADFLAWQRNYTGSNPSMVVAVPEPAAAALVICAMMALSWFTRPKRLAN